ncbi:MAG: polyprenyl synthetase family protein [Planctomycetota bacterium]|jgi:geranylgeranyl pyrophosphate synthase
MRRDIITSAKNTRSPQKDIPSTKEQRNKVLGAVREYAGRENLVGPISLDELRRHCEKIIETYEVDPKHLKFLVVLLNNEIWRHVVAGVANNKRLLLLPKCLRDNDKCPADFDEVGLVCEHCGRCIIDELQSQAEQLGYAVLIAEGSPVVMSLIQTGKIEAVIGVSCLDVLEKTFPYMEAGAVPGMAIPLLHDGCANTSVDVDWVLEAIYETGTDESCRLDLQDLRKKVQELFTKERLEPLLQPGEDQTGDLAFEWLSRAGKRWRPFLAVCVYQALMKTAEDAFSGELSKVAVAVECFHKASLIHDDIEDGDVLRYGQKTLHAEYGIPIALNAGDFLLGEGYRLLAEAKVSADCCSQMLRVAAGGHRQLCLGQGSELFWVRQPKPLSVAEVIDIFQKKTSPAFEVALRLGAILAGADEQLADVLTEYSESLGVAYQIMDDVNDFDSKAGLGDLIQKRPSVLLAIAYERADDDDKKLLESVWKRSAEPGTILHEVTKILATTRAKRVALDLMETYRLRAISSLATLQNPALKALLRRIVSKIFSDIDVMGCCNEHKAANAEGSKPG